MFKIYEMVALLRGFRKDDRGVTALEYGLIAALIGGAIVTGVAALGTDMGSLFTKIGDKIRNKTPA